MFPTFAAFLVNYYDNIYVTVYSYINTLIRVTIRVNSDVAAMCLPE
jgi:hypothetical protein